MSDLKQAFEALKAKQRPYDEYWDYYAGKHPLVYSAARLREVFRGLEANFVENWCAVVVDVPLERLVLERIEVAGNPTATARLEELWATQDLDLDVDDAHESLLVTGEAFFIVWPGTDESGANAFFNDSRLCAMFYEADNPRKPRYAAKWWVNDDSEYRLNLYYADRVEYYAARARAGVAPSSEKAFAVYQEPVENPFGRVPVFHLRSGRYQRSVLDDAIPLQAAINKLLADEMVAAEFGAFKQRWVISNAEIATLKNAPNEIWNIPAGDGIGQGTAVGEFSETQLANFEASIERRVAALSAITRIPPYYFFRSGGQPPSGESLMVLESPLNKRIKRLQNRLMTVWQQLAAFMLAVEGLDVNQEDVRPVYASPETIQPRTSAEIRQLSVAAGMPLTTALRREGWTDEDLSQVEADKIAEQAAAQESLARALVEQQRAMDRG